MHPRAGRILKLELGVNANTIDLLPGTAIYTELWMDEVDISKVTFGC